jgi:hypothetical protein
VTGLDVSYVPIATIEHDWLSGPLHGALFSPEKYAIDLDGYYSGSHGDAFAVRGLPSAG